MIGYMIETADNTPMRDPKNWTIEDENGIVVHTVVDEKERDRNTQKIYLLDGAGAEYRKIVLKVSESQGPFIDCQLCRF